MTIRTIKTNLTEADLIMKNKIGYIIRSDKEPFKENDVIQFMVMRDKKPIKNSIDNNSYVVTNVKDSMQTPIDRGLQIISFRKLS